MTSFYYLLQVAGLKQVTQELKFKREWRRVPLRLKAHWCKNDLEYLTLNLRTTRSKPTPSHQKKKIYIFAPEK